MTDIDPRLGLNTELLPDNARAAVAALDSRHVIVDGGPTTASALTAAAIIVLVARTHAHVTVRKDARLPHNPWGAETLTGLLQQLQPLRPRAQAAPETDIVISTDTKPGANTYVAPAAWTVAIADHPTDVPDPADELSVAPYGGMFAAALVAADLFCASIGHLGLPIAERRPNFIYNLIDHTHNAAPDAALSARAPEWTPVLFAGCGSVGSSASAALACDNLFGMTAHTVDGDTFDPERNPFRYPAAIGTERGNKADWVATTLGAAGAATRTHETSVHSWTISQPAPGFDGIVLSSVDTVDGRYEVADLLGRTTISAAVSALSFHIQREHLGDGNACPFCDFVTLASPLAQAAADAQLTGLDEKRVVELLYKGLGLEQADLETMITAGKLSQDNSSGLLGRRIADLRHRLYAQAAIPQPENVDQPTTPLSAPFVSWATGVLLAAEVAKDARGLPLIDRRVEIDLHGYPPGYTYTVKADSSGRCACARSVRTRWMERLYS